MSANKYPSIFSPQMEAIVVIILTTIFVDTQLWKTKHPRKRSKISVSRVLLTDRIEIHQLQPLVRPSNLLYVILQCFQ